MFIISKDKDAHIEYHGAALKTSQRGGVQIIALLPNSSGKNIGEYPKERAYSILREIALNMVSGNDLFWMPEE